MARTLFLYTRDQDEAPIFFRSDAVAHFVRGPVADASTRPVYFTGGPAPRPSYTMLPFSTSGAGDKPQEFFTLGLPRPDMSSTPADSSDIDANTVSIEAALYRQSGKYTYASKGDVDHTYPLGTVQGNGLDDVLVYVNVGIDYSSDSINANDLVETTVSLLVDSVVVDIATVSGTSGSALLEGRQQVYAGVLRVPAAVGAKAYAIKIQSSGSGFSMSGVNRVIYLLDSAAFHENTTIAVDQDFRALSAGDSVTLAGVGATFVSQASRFNNVATGPFAPFAERDEFYACYRDGSTGRPADQTSNTINGSREIVRTTSNTIVVRGAWPWVLSNGGAGGTVSFDGITSIGDPSSVQGIGYVVTFLTTIGNQVLEGPPSAMSGLISTRPGLPVSLSGLPTGTNEGGDYRFSGKRLYRTNVTTDGIGVLQFVAELPIEQSSYVDTVRAVDLGETLQTEDWIMPPSDMFGLVACHNGMLAGISGNQVCVSVPFQPHAWPTSSRFNIGDEPVALVAVGEVIVVLTKGRPSAIYGFEPESMRVVPVDAAYPCVNPAGAVSIGDAAIYPSTIGLVAVPARGAPFVVTEKIMEKEEWAGYFPETIIAAEHHGKYLGFYDDGEAIKSFLLDPYSRVSSWTDLDIEADAVCTDERDGNALFMAPGGSAVMQFDPPTGDSMEYLWRSKTFATQRPWCPAYARVVAESYPVTYRLYANKPQPGQFDTGGGTTEATMLLIHERAVTSSRPFPLPGDYRATAFEIELTNAAVEP